MNFRGDVVCCAERHNTAGYTQLCVLVDKRPSKTPRHRIQSYNLYMLARYLVLLETTRRKVYFTTGGRLRVNKRTLKT